MRLDALLDVLRQVAPERLAEPWDKAGLQVGDTARRVRRSLLCIDLTPAVLAEAASARAELVVAYHPLIFEPLPAVTAGDARQRVVMELIERRIAVYSPHTALDAATGGINDWLAEAAGPGRARPIRLAPAGQQSRYTLVTFVPVEKADALRRALAQAGAGRIGDYTECSFNVEGTGTFRGGATSNPTVGRRGEFERVTELRMEMVCPADRVTQVVAALRRAHPYETPAFDLYRIEAEPSLQGEGGAGQGRVVDLERPVTLAALARAVKRRLRVRRLQVAAPAAGRAGAGGASGNGRPLRRIGVCAGAGGGLLEEAGELDAYITGEMRHHDVLAAVARGTAVLLAGHTQTERPYLPRYRERLIEGGAGEVEWIVSRADAPPERWV